MYIAEDVLAFTLYDYERDKADIPVPSEMNSFSLSDNEFVNMIYYDTIAYQKRNNNKAVKKTLSIPEWLNEAAIAANINFLQVLQDALKAKLGLM